MPEFAVTTFRLFDSLYASDCFIFQDPHQFLIIENAINDLIVLVLYFVGCWCSLQDTRYDKYLFAVIRSVSFAQQVLLN